MKVTISKWDDLPSGTYELIETSDKLTRAITKAGPMATPRGILIEHDKLGGLIRDGRGNKMQIHTFWNVEKQKLAEKQGRKERWAKKMAILKSFVEFIKGFKEIVWFVLFLLGIGLFFYKNKIWPFSQ